MSISNERRARINKAVEHELATCDPTSPLYCQPSIPEDETLRDSALDLAIENKQLITENETLTAECARIDAAWKAIYLLLIKDAQTYIESAMHERYRGDVAEMALELRYQYWDKSTKELKELAKKVIEENSNAG